MSLRSLWRSSFWALVLALPLCQAAKEQGQASSGKESSLTRERKAKLQERDALIPQIRKLNDAGELDEAARLLEKMMALEKAIFGPVHDEVAGSLDQLGDIHVRRGDLAAARKARTDALAMYRTLHGDKHWMTTNARLDLEEVDLLARMTLQEREQVKQADLLEQEAMRQSRSGKIADVEKDRQALDIRLKVLGDHRKTATSHSRLAEDLRRLGKTHEAVEQDRQALKMRLRVLGVRHPDTAASYDALGLAIRRSSFYLDFQPSVNYAEAEKMDRAALAIRRQALGEDHEDTLRSVLNLALDLHHQKRYAEAVELKLQVVAARTRNLRGDNITPMRSLVVTWTAWLAPLVEKVPSPLDPGFGDAEKRLRTIGKFLWGAEAPSALDELKKKLLREADSLHRVAQLREADLRNKVAHQVGSGHYGPGSSLSWLAFALRRDILGDHAATVDSGKLASWELNRDGLFKEAETVARAALAMSNRVHGPAHEQSRLVLRNLTQALRDQGRFTAAEKWDRQALGLDGEIPGLHHQGNPASLKDLANDLQLQGRFAEAELLFRKALVIQDQTLGESHFETLLTMSQLARAMREGGKEAQAQTVEMRIHRTMENLLEMNKNRLPLNHAIVMRAIHDLAHPEKAQFDYRLLCRNLNSLAVSRMNTGNYRGAESLLQLVLPLQNMELIYPPGDALMRVEKASIRQNLARAQWNLGQFKAALDLQAKAIDLYREAFGEEHPLTLQSYNRMAHFLVLQGDFRVAEGKLNETLSEMERILGADHPSTVADSVDWIRALWAQGKFAEATEAATAKAEAFQKARLRVSSTGLDRSALSARQATPMVYLAALLARDGKPADAWRFLEDDLGRGLLDDLSARTSRPLKPDQRLQEEALQGRISLLEKQLTALLDSKKAEPEKVANLRLERDKLMVQLGQFQADLEKQYGPAAGQVYDLKRIQDSLGPDTALIGWVDIEGHTRAKEPGGEHWAVAIRNQGPPVWVKLEPAREGPWAEKDQELPSNVLKVLSNPQTAPAAELQALYRQRLRPLEKHLKGVRHLVVLPSAGMAGIPIEALADRYRVSYAPSGTIYAWLQEQCRKLPAGTGELLALGDPVFSPEQAKQVAGKKQQVVTRLLRGESPKPLPGTRREVEAIAGLFAARNARVVKLLGNDASGPNLDRLVENKALAHFRYLHLATHGYADPWGGMASYLALTPSDFALASHDKLSAGHILRTWKLEADLVTLSACQTALGEHRGGEGYVGFSQALFFAGARTLVLSQWRVDDTATSLFMLRFYQNLLGQRDGLRVPLAKGEALREAQTWLRGLSRTDVGNLPRSRGLDLDDLEKRLPAGDRPYAHPYYWAAFVLIGDPGDAS
jgi:CHAT domain-containing protein/tetratricopeptide (TPR) repeat protein